MHMAAMMLFCPHLRLFLCLYLDELEAHSESAENPNSKPCVAISAAKLPQPMQS